MFCSNCGKQLEDGSKFCPSCGKQLVEDVKSPVIDDAHIEATTPTTTTATDKKEAGQKWKSLFTKKNLTIAGIIAGALVLIAGIILLTIFVFVPSAKWNKAVNLMEEGKYSEAYIAMQGNIHDYSTAEECYKLAIHQFIIDGNIIEAHDFIYNYRLLYSFEATSFAELGAPSEYDSVKLFEGIIAYLNQDDVDLTDHIGYLYDDFLSFLFSLVPQSVSEDAGKLRIFIDDIKAMDRQYASSECFDYIINNRSIIEYLWKYKAVRNLVEQEMEAFLIDTRWESGYTYIEFRREQDYTLNGKPHYTATEMLTANISMPDVEHRYFEIKDMILYFCNANDSKICDVFRFELDESSPDILHVYCYEDGETVTLYNK